MGKFKASKKVVEESFAVLKQDREMLWFPVISFVACLIIVAIVALFSYKYWGNSLIQEDGARYTAAIVFIVSYLVMFFITNMSNAAIMTIAYSRFKGQDLNFRDGLHGAIKNIGKIFFWSLIGATVNYILDFLSEKFKIIGKIIVFFLSAAWEIMTYFYLPSLIIGQNSIRNSFKESAALIRKTWGEAIIINIGVGIYLLVVYMSIFVLATLLIIIFPFTLVFWMVIALAVLGFLATALIFSTLNVIFRLALYEYARTGVVPTGFSPELIQTAIKAKA